MAERYHFELLAPDKTCVGCGFSHFRISFYIYNNLLDQLMRLRGCAYLEDGAIAESELDEAGRFEMSGDEKSWHLMLVENGSNEVIACARFLLHPNTVSFGDLSISRSFIACDADAGPVIRRMVEGDILQARRELLSYVEVGGWAVARPWRGTKAALDVLAGAYALGDLWGGCLGLCTATFRHGSASIIRKFAGGATSATDVSPFTVYYDPHYACPMELLRLKDRPADRYTALVQKAKQQLSSIVPVMGSRNMGARLSSLVA